MIINLSPQRRDDVLAISKLGDVLTINGEVFDFSIIPDGATLPSSAVTCAFITGVIERIAGDLKLTLLLPNSANASNATRFPQPIINPPNGIVGLPV